MMHSTESVDGIYPSTGGYAHSMLVESPSRWLFTSGTMGLDGKWNALPSIEEQLDAIWSNIDAILSANDFSLADIVHLTCMLADPEYAKVNAAAIKSALQGRNVPRTVFCVQLLNPSWLAEIQVTAAQ